MDPLRDVFVDLDPPPGGLISLRERLDRRRRWRMPALTLAAAAVVLLLALPPRQAPPDLSPLLDPPTAPVSVLPSAADQLAVREVPTDSPDLVHYRLDGTARVPTTRPD